MSAPSPPKTYGSTATTAGVRVDAVPYYLPERSTPATDVQRPQHVWAYRIRVTNVGEHAVTLLSRVWRIVDADGECKEVRGEGVVGQQPTIAPGKWFEYTSFCPLPTDWGTMEGEYTMRYDGGPEGGMTFTARIARFYLVLDAEDPVR